MIERLGLLLTISSLLAFEGVSLAHETGQQRRGTLNHEPLVAINFNVPNFTPEYGYIPGDYLFVVLPEALVLGALDQVLRANEGRIKDTQFQKIDISDFRSSFIYDELFDSCGNRPNCIPSGSTKKWSGIRVSGRWSAQLREKISCIGRCRYTPWYNTSGTFSVPLYYEVSGGNLTLRAGGLTFKGSKWDASLVEFIAGAIDVHDGIRQSIQNALSTYDGMSIKDLLAEKAAETAQQIGIDEGKARQFVDNNIGQLQIYNGTAGPGAQGLCIVIP